MSIRAQKEFAKEFTRVTGLNSSVVVAWMLHEQPVGQSAKGGNDWLNIEAGKRGGSGPNSAESNYVEKLSPTQAADYTARWIAENQPSILRARGKGTAAEVSAIESSGFAGSKYGNAAPEEFLSAAKNAGFFEEDIEELDKSFGLPSEGPVKFAKKIEGPIKTTEEGISGIGEFLDALSEPETWLRIAEGVGGVLLLFIALKQLSSRIEVTRMAIGHAEEGSQMTIRTGKVVHKTTVRASKSAGRGAAKATQAKKRIEAAKSAHARSKKFGGSDADARKAAVRAAKAKPKRSRK